MAARALLCVALMLASHQGYAALRPPDAMTPTKAQVNGPSEAPSFRPSEQLDKVERQALYERYKFALAKELGLLQTLDGFDHDIEKLDERISRLAGQRAEATAALRQAEVTRATAARRLSTARRDVRLRLRALVRMRRLPNVRLLMSPEAFSESVVKDRVLRRLVLGDHQRLASYRAQLREVERDTKERDERLSKLRAFNEQLHAERLKVQQKRHDKLLLLLQIQRDPIYNDYAKRDMDAANLAMRDKIQGLKMWRQRRYPFGRMKGKVLPPLNRYKVEVPFGPHRHPVFGTTTWHRGVDLRVIGGGTAPVRALASARVAYVGWLTGYGDTVVLDHGRGWHSVYAHVEQIKVTVGEVVRPRQRLAMVGASGSLKGRYLYVEIRENGREQNPQLWFR